MTLCVTCKGVDFRALLVACLEQCKGRQKPDGEYHYEAPPLSHTHHDDIFQIKNSSRDCHLCKAIFQAFERRHVADVEEARGLPIVIRAWGNKVEVCYDAEEGLIKLCGLDWYMSEVDGEYNFLTIF
jgi:hypothetical protein